MNAKLSLNLNTLSVESFNTANAPVQPGSPADEANLRTCMLTNCGNIQCCA
ncbi:MAG TPA: hypothetical protein VHG91_02565 [Longimicrobium sp.]|nr:hypothetical protein [Longimicrobium sp.]